MKLIEALLGLWLRVLVLVFKLCGWDSYNNQRQ